MSLYGKYEKHDVSKRALKIWKRLCFPEMIMDLVNIKNLSNTLITMTGWLW